MSLVVSEESYASNVAKAFYQLSMCGSLLGMHRFCLMHPARSSQLHMTVYCKQHCGLLPVIYHHLSIPISIAGPVDQTRTCSVQHYSIVCMPEVLRLFAAAVQACKGLDAAEAGKRLDLLGSNAIPYKATSWMRLFVDECFRL